MELYFSPLACSMATRIALYEAGAEATYRYVDTRTKRVEGDADFYGVNLFNILGTSTAFIGFGGSTGGLNAQQLISNFTYLGASGATTAFASFDAGPILPASKT